MKIKLFLLMCIPILLNASVSYRELYLKGDLKALTAALDSMEKSRAEVPSELLFYSAELMENVPRSVACYTQIVNSRTDSPFYNASQLRLAKYHSLQQDSSKAALYLKRIISSKDSILSPLAYLSLIAIYERFGDISNASKYIRDFQTDFPSSQFSSYYSTEKSNHSVSKDVFYTIQIGSFKNVENADKMMDEYKKKRYDVYKINDKELIKVRIGKFKTENDANKFLKVFQKAETIPAWVVKAE
ncbi:MAG: SPOR domain-containing protein [bacterium]